MKKKENKIKILASFHLIMYGKNLALKIVYGDSAKILRFNNLRLLSEFMQNIFIEVENLPEEEEGDLDDES
jgi:hypothetical protein